MNPGLSPAHSSHSVVEISGFISWSLLILIGSSKIRQIAKNYVLTKNILFYSFLLSRNRHSSSRLCTYSTSAKWSLWSTSRWIGAPRHHRAIALQGGECADTPQGVPPLYPSTRRPTPQRTTRNSQRYHFIWFRIYPFQEINEEFVNSVESVCWYFLSTGSYFLHCWKI